MGLWCPRCRSEYVEGVYTCPDCDVPLVQEHDLPPEPQETDFSPDDAIFIEPKAARDHSDPFVPIWEGPTGEAQRLMEALSDAAIPVDLDESDDVGRSRLEVPRSYGPEARGILDSQGFDAILSPPRAPTPDDFLDAEPAAWPTWVRVALWGIAIVLIVSLVLTSRF